VATLTLDRLNLIHQSVELIEKGNKSRIIPVSAVTVAALIEWLAVRPITDDPHVFLNRLGKPLTKNGVYQLVERVAIRAGVHGRSNPHAFRHTFGRRWVESGGDISPLSDMLGHTQIGITKRYYLRYNVETVRKEHRQHSPLAGWKG
ncbi:MAG: tyrosine-type recombinase/integrase, partial [Anaerolineae bacterium]|nr:tyrosine-type recombinase/integrase [Anaerolineae bacterium]